MHASTKSQSGRHLPPAAFSNSSCLTANSQNWEQEARARSTDKRGAVVQAWHPAPWRGRCRVAGGVSTFSMLPAALDSNAAVWDRPRHCLLEAVLGLLPLFHGKSQDFHGKSWCCSRWRRRIFASFKAAKSAEFARTLKCQALLQSFMAMQARRTHGHEGLKPRLWLRGSSRLLRSLQRLMPVIWSAAMLDGSCLHELHMLSCMLDSKGRLETVPART